jgi:hypothetical protein
VVLLLVWLGFFGQLILYGAALNVVLDRRRRGEPIMPDPPGGTPAVAGAQATTAPGPEKVLQGRRSRHTGRSGRRRQS